MWEDVEVTAVEYNSLIADCYNDNFPDDEVIVYDALKFVEENDLSQWDFIWASPPCQTHSMLMRYNFKTNTERIKIPDMTSLYGLIVYLNTFFKDKWIVENVGAWYPFFYKPSVKLGKNYFWCNFKIEKKRFNYFIVRTHEYDEPVNIKEYYSDFNIDALSSLNSHKIVQILRNIVEPEVGKYILDQVRNPSGMKQGEWW